MATGRIPTTANSPLTAKGDLFTFSTSSAKLAVGSNGDTLVADSSATTGLRYQGNYAAGKNKIINGDFNVWQRGTSIAVSASTTGFGADRWGIAVGTSAAVTLSRQAFTPGTAPVAGYEGNYFLRCNRTTTGSSPSYFFQRIEDVTTFAGQTVTFSFWAKASSTFTFSTGEIYLEQNFGSGGSGAVTTNLNTSTQTITTSWARYSFTVTVPSISGKTIGTSSFLAVVFNCATSQSTFTLDFWGVQLEAGSTATAFQTATGTIQGELAACQRYYHRFSGEGQATAALINSGLAFSTTVAMFIFNLGTTMRTGPGTMQVSNQGIYRPTNATAYSGGTWSLNQTFDNSVRAIYTHGSAVFVAGESLISSSTTTSNYFAFDAEL